ncbi:hypothetical protein I4U23_017163 [Adineta vaga]|nr:hypothetical protein I4U23_017163 [Adineta vaga]
MGKLDGKIALVTGGSEGIGFATAEIFVSEGAYVFITELRKELLDSAVKQIGRNVYAIQADSSKLDDLDNVYKIINEEKEKASITVNGSCFSIKGIPATSIYSATKAALRSFARCWSVDLKDRQIRVNTLSPGPTDTPLLNNLADTKESSQEILDNFAKMTVMDRLAQPIEIANFALFLASDDSSYITGIELFADGGASQI